MRSIRVIETSVLSTVFLLTVVLVPACGSESSSDDGSPAGSGGTAGSGGSSGNGGTSGGAAGSSGGSAGSAGSAGNAGSANAGSAGMSGSAGSGGSGDAGPGNCGQSFVVTYTINGKFTIANTPLGAGDSQNNIGPGELAIRFTGTSGPAAGRAALLSYRMPQVFTVNKSGVVVATNVTATAANDCSAASGTVAGTTLAWATCTYGAGHGTTEWGPASGASGPGCVQHYNSKGNVNCMGALCSAGGLAEGDNPQDVTYDQPLNSFVFSADFKSFTMRGAGGPAGSDDKGVEVPNNAPGRTWLNLDGTEKERKQLATPACACP